MQSAMKLKVFSDWVFQFRLGIFAFEDNFFDFWNVFTLIVRADLFDWIGDGMADVVLVIIGFIEETL